MFDSGPKLPENHVFPIRRSFDSCEINRSGNTQEREKAEESWLWGSRIMGSGRKLSIDLNDDDNRESGVRSQPLWRKSPTASPPQRKNHYRSLSPSSRAQAIARGQKELMEMVSKMPESSYELSLKDLVEQPQPPTVEKESSIANNNNSNKSGDKSFREKGNKRNEYNNHDQNNNKTQMVMKRSGSLDNDRFLIKMAFPVPLGNAKKNHQHLYHKRNMKKATSDLGLHTSGFNSKVTPKPRPAAIGDGSGKSLEKEWWKKKQSFSSLAEADQYGGSSGHSGSAKSSSAKSSSPNSSRGSSSSNDSRHGNAGCWSFIRTRRKKKAHK